MRKGYSLFIPLLFSFFICFNPLFAASTTKNETLRIGITGYAPPYIMQSGYHQFYGFDISMMDYICQSLEKKCQYVPMNFNELFISLNKGDIDLALSAIVITLDASKYYLFSAPYMTSQGQFITKSSNKAVSLSNASLANKKIGVVNQTAYAKEIVSIAPKAKIIQFDSNEALISSIKSGETELGFLDYHTALYWEHNSNMLLKSLGRPIDVGYGLGILANQTRGSLIQNINFVLIQYQNNGQFKKDYAMYLNDF